jgi:predicted Zn-dependent peptidase
VTLPPYRMVTLANGARLILMEKHDVPMISFSARIAGGAVADPAGRAGTAAVLAELLQKGAGRRDAAQFASAVDSVGGELSVAADQEAIDVAGNFLSRDTGLMVGLLADMLERPRLGKEEFDKVRGRYIQSLKAAKDADPRSLLDVYGDACFFGDHPYGRPLTGDETSLAALQYADVLAYYRNQVGADRLILSVVGDFDTSAMLGRLREALAGWRRAAQTAPRVPVPQRRAGRRVLLVDKPGATQTYFWIGNLGVARDDPRRVAIDLANTVFGGRFTSLLNTALRIKSGLTYGARSSLERLRHPGTLSIQSYTRTETTVTAIDKALAVLANFRAQGMDADTLASAKAYVLGQFPLRLETDGQIAARLAELAFYGLGRQEVDGYASAVEATGLDDIRAVARDVYPDPDNLTFVLIGNAAAIRGQIGKYGPVTEMSITDPRFRPGS